MNRPPFLIFARGRGGIIDIFSHLKKKQKTFNIGFFLDTMKARSFKLCTIINFLGVYIVILGLITLTLFQGHRCVRNINWKLHVLDSLSSLV